MFSISPDIGNDIDPGPPPEIAARIGLYPANYPGLAPMAAPLFPQSLRLRLKLKPAFGVASFVTTTLNHNLALSLPSTNLGATFLAGPLEIGTRFGLNREHRGLWLTNATFIRHVERTFDVGLEGVSRYSLTTGKELTTRQLLGSAALHPYPDAPALRVTSAIFTQTGRGFSAVSTFGRF